MKQNIYDNEVFFNGYRALRESGVTYNDFVEQPAIKSAITCLKGKTVLDIGCGDGRFAKYCIDNGASRVLGIDISKNMIEKAKIENKHEKIEYICTPIEDIELNHQTFDIIVSSLAIHYIEDYQALIGKINKMLEKNGEFIFSIEHPIATARKEMGNWIIDDQGNRLHYAIDHYQEEGKREIHWYVDGVVKYHRTISTIINTLIDQGLTVAKIIEPQSTPSGLEQMPKLINEQRRPSFLIVKSRKI